MRNNLGLTTRMVNEAIEFLVIRGLLNEVHNFGITEFMTAIKGESALKQYYNLISEFFTTQ
jgi:predicted transcriptional regulator